MTSSEWLSAAESELSTDARTVYTDLCELADVDGEVSADVWPFVECPCCGRPIIASCYAGFLSVDLPPEVFSVFARGVEYCAECAGELTGGMS